MRLPAILPTVAAPGAQTRSASLLRERLRTARPLRVALLLGLLALLNGFDLGFTLLADRHDRLIELNPVAASFVAQEQWLPLATYKFALVIIGMGILWGLRRYVLAEWAAWFIVLAYVGVAWRWHDFLSQLPSWHTYVYLPLV